MKKKIVFGLILIVLGMQFISFREDPPVADALSILEAVESSSPAADIVKTVCYDCHSYETKYPWYASIAPISWIIDHHVNEGREHLNFSIWSEYDAKKADHKLEECIEEVEEGEMPLEGYALLHANAKLSSEQRKQLMDWFRQLRKEAN